MIIIVRKIKKDAIAVVLKSVSGRIQNSKMAYVNVLDWRCEQVAHWLRGLDDSIYPYCHYFVNNNVDGQKLLNLTVSDLIKLHVEKLGHQEIILEGLELLKNLVWLHIFTTII